MAELRETPYANPLTGLSNDVIQGLLGYMKDKQRTQQMQGLASLLENTGIPKTVERAAYAESPTGLLNALTNVNRANVPLLKPETADALMNVAPMVAPATRAMMQATKGLPVGASIKSIDDIFSKYPDVIIDASVGKKDINLSRIVVPKEMRNQGVGTQVMSDLSEYADSIGKRITLTPSDAFGGSVPKLKTFYKELGFVENKGKNKDFSTREAMYREPQPVEKSASYPQQEALDTAQRNAALPVEEGGLGLPKDNTPEMRAEAMGYKTPAYHGTTVWEAEDGRKLGDIEAFNRLASTEIVGRKPSIDQMGIWASDRPDASGAGMYSGSQGAIYPLMLRMENPKATSFEQMARTASNLSEGKVLGATEVPRVSDVEPYRQRLKEQGYDSLMLKAKEGSPYTEFVDQTGYVLLEPSQVRSRFAAFDPKRKNEADILAGVLPLGLLADEEQRKKLYELMPSLLGE